MVNSLNKVTLIGRLGKDPDIRTMSNNKQLASFFLATSESWFDKFTNERKENTEWHNVVIFNEKLVEIVQKYLTKGSKIYLEGSLKTRKWTDNNINERYSYTTEVVLQFNSQLIMLDERKNDEANSKQAFPSTKESPTAEVIDDDIPF